MFSSLKNNKKCTPTGEFISILLIGSKHTVLGKSPVCSHWLGPGFHQVELVRSELHSYTE